MAPKPTAERTHSAIPRRCGVGLPVAVVRTARVRTEARRERSVGAEDSEDSEERDHDLMIDHAFSFL
jgi:hypothetical protein